MALFPLFSTVEQTSPGPGHLKVSHFKNGKNPRSYCDDSSAGCDSPPPHTHTHFLGESNVELIEVNRMSSGKRKDGTCCGVQCFSLRMRRSSWEETGGEYGSQRGYVGFQKSSLVCGRCFSNKPLTSFRMSCVFFHKQRPIPGVRIRSVGCGGETVLNMKEASQT